MVGGMRTLLVALAVALIASGEASAQMSTQPTGPSANFCALQTLSVGAAPRAGTIAAGRGRQLRDDDAERVDVRARCDRRALAQRR